MTDEAGSPNQDLTTLNIYGLARTDFGTFFEIAFTILHPCRTIDYAPYLDLLIHPMNSCAKGRYSRMIINLPRGFYEIE
jgi:hypothetical protein